MVQENIINENEFLLFKGYIEESCGIAIPPEKAYLIESRLTKLMLDVGTDSFGEFYSYIKGTSDSIIRQKIIDAITTNETLWFRDSLPWQVLEERYLPKLIEELRAGRKERVRIWCAAVSTGQEAYSTVMCVDNYLRENNINDVELSNFEFLATDISSRVLDIAKKGRYDKISIMRGLDDDYREKYFTEIDAAWEIDSKIRNAVKFEHFNLKDSYWRLGQFDIIFCRYVLIYFSEELKEEIILKMKDSLANDGILFTGNYVLYDLLKDIYKMEHYNNLTYYTKKVVIT